MGTWLQGWGHKEWRRGKKGEVDHEGGETGRERKCKGKEEEELNDIRGGIEGWLDRGRSGELVGRENQEESSAAKERKPPGRGNWEEA